MDTGLMLINRTPLETYELGGCPVLVKREDLCCPPPGPSFSKARGVVGHIQSLPMDTIGVLDTFHSKAGWAVAWACNRLGKRCVVYWPRYKADTERVPRVQQQNAQQLGAHLVDLPAGRSAVLYHAAKKHLAANWPGAYMMPNALKISESVEENAAEVLRTKLPPGGTLVISISSGTIAAGVIRGLHLSHLWGKYQVIAHMGYSRSFEAAGRYMEEKSRVTLDGFVDIVDEGYAYKDEAKGKAPFPCNSHYDLKAWNWLSTHIEQLKAPVVFWNIGE